MMSRSHRFTCGSWFRLALAAAALTVGAGRAWAQSVPSGGWSGGAVPHKIELGQTVRVTTVTGLRVEGQVTGVTSTALRLRIATQVDDGAGRYHLETKEVVFAASDVSVITKPGPIWDGAVKGFLVGAVFLTLGRAWSYGDVVAPVSGISAGIGLGIDAAFGPKKIYRAGSPSRLTVSPIVDKTHRGIAATIRF